jgi:hypothetical protein
MMAVMSAAGPAGDGRRSLGPDDRALLETYARDTWRSVEELRGRGVLPVDTLRRNGERWVVSGLTSPTDIAASFWSTIAAEDLGLITRDQARLRLKRDLDAVSRLERSREFFFNWYDPATGARARTWPGGGSIRPFLSSVDNGWLAVAMMMVGEAHPELRPAAEVVLGPMNLGFFYDPYDPADPKRHPGQLWGGYWTDDGAFAGFHYGTLNTEPRIASYVGIARGELPPEHYYRMVRGFSSCRGGAAPPTRMYAGVPVVQGATCFRGVDVVPSWDGTMFEALMVPLFVPEEEWAPASWGANHPLYVRAQVEYGLHEAGLGVWGTSAACAPGGVYRAFGVPGLGLTKGSQATVPIVAPHASFLALRYAPGEAMENLRVLARDFGAYGPFGFFDSVDAVSRKVSDCVLIVDQAMILAAIDNALRDGAFRKHFSTGEVERAVRPLIAPERFEVGAGDWGGPGRAREKGDASNDGAGRNRRQGRSDPPGNGARPRGVGRSGR